MAIEKSKANHFRESTKKNYYAIWKVFNKFFLRLDVKPDNWEDRLVLFAGFLANEHKRPTTIKSYVSAIKAILQVGGLEINEDRFLLSSITKACSYKDQCPRMHLPIHKTLLKAILAQIDVMYDTQFYLRKLLWQCFQWLILGYSEWAKLPLGHTLSKRKTSTLAATKRN